MCRSRCSRQSARYGKFGVRLRFVAAYNFEQDRLVWQQKELGTTCRTAATRFQCISNTVSDPNVIRDFLFAPDQLTDEVRETLKNTLQSNNLLYVAPAPSLPVVVVGSDEGLLYVLDSRDFRLVQTIDSSAGKGTTLHGLCFSSQKQFAVFSSLGSVSFYSLAASSYEAALHYLDAMP